MKLLLMADKYVGEGIARWLLAEYPRDIALVVVRDDGAIAADAREAKVDYLVYESDADVVEAVEQGDGSIDLGVLAWWPSLVSQPLLAIPRNGFVNTHPSLLPHNRGKHYNFWAIVEEAPFGVSLNLVGEGIDAGDIVAQRPIPYDWLDTGETLYAKATDAMIQLFRDTYPTLRTLRFDRRPQELSAGSFHVASELDVASHFELDQTYLARDLLNLLRARTFPPHPASSFSDDGVTYEVRVTITRRDR